MHSTFHFRIVNYEALWNICNREEALHLRRLRILVLNKRKFLSFPKNRRISGLEETLKVTQSCPCLHAVLKSMQVEWGLRVCTHLLLPSSSCDVTPVKSQDGAEQGPWRMKAPDSPPYGSWQEVCRFWCPRASYDIHLTLWAPAQWENLNLLSK